MSQNLDESQNVNESPVNNSSDEKLLPQSKVNEIVSNEKFEARQKGINEGFLKAKDILKDELKQEIKSMIKDSGLKNEGLNEGSIAEIVEKKVKQGIADTFQKIFEDQAMNEAKQIENLVRQKSEEGKAKYGDYESVVGDPFERFGDMKEVAAYAAMVDNTADVLYNLGQHPEKAMTIYEMHKKGLQKDAVKAIQSLSNTLKQNELAKNEKKSPQPTVQLKSSNQSVGKLDINDRSFWKGKW